MATRKSSETKTEGRLTEKSAPDPQQAVSAVEGVQPSSSGDALSLPKVAQRAFQLYEDRGAEDGHAVDDWLQAEREVLDRDA